MAKKSFLSFIWITFFSYFFILMIKLTWQYIPLRNDISFLQIKQSEVNEIPFYLYFFYVHVYSAIFVLLAGFTQFSNYILEKKKSIHKNIGKFYVFIVLFLSAPSGLYIGVFANGGFYSKVSFVTLSILWFYFTFKGFTSIKNKNLRITKHLCCEVLP